MKSLTGTWRLIKTECITADGTKLEPPYGGTSAMGLVSMSASGRLVCVLCDSRENPPGSSREYNSYCGAYTYDGKQLTTRVDVSANASWVGTDQIRDVSFEDEVMVLKPTQNTGPVSDGQRVLYWVRLPDVDNG